MRTVLLASLRAYARRYVAAGLAVIIGVAFIVVTGALSSATRNGLVAGVAAPYAGASVVVTGLDGDQAATLIDGAPDDGAQATLLGWTRQPVSADDGLLAERADIGQVATAADLQWQVLRAGRLPTGSGEAVADERAAEGAGVAVGDRLQVGSGSRAAQVTVVGLVDSPSALVAAAYYLVWSDLAPFAGDLYVDSVAYAGPGPVDRQVAAVVALVPTADVRPTDDFVRDRQAEVTEGVDTVALVLLLFAAIALGVAVIVIANTFAILVAQRQRDLALLRCVGATRRQVLRGVRTEALVIGGLATALGLAVGVGLGHGLVALIRSAWPAAALGAVELSLPWYAAAAVVGVLVTLVAAWLPTRRVVRVDPLSALRLPGAVDPASATGRIRLAAGSLLWVVGAVGLAVAVVAQSSPSMLVGGAAAFAGTLVLGPVVVPAVIRALGALCPRAAGPVPRLAVQNAVRNPRRTATTTASLLVGVTLTTAVLSGLASSRGAVEAEMDLSHPLDAVFVATGTDLAGDLADRVAAAPGVDRAVALSGTTATLSGVPGEVQLVAVPADEGLDGASVAHGRPAFLAPGPGEITLPIGVGPDDGGPVTVEVGGRTLVLTARPGDGFGVAALVAPATLARLTDSAGVRAVWARAVPGADAEDVTADLDALAVAAGAELSSGLAQRAYVDLQLDVLTGAVVGLLGIAVVIALIGIANTLGLSVLERSGENALLRAMGLTRRQLRATLAVEAVLLAVVGSLLGLALGSLFGWVGVQAMVEQVVDDVPFVLPLAQVGLVVLVIAVAGLLAGVLPARRAARTAPAQGLALT